MKVFMDKCDIVTDCCFDVGHLYECVKDLIDIIYFI